jgi:hypothetical protein
MLNWAAIKLLIKNYIQCFLSGCAVSTAAPAPADAVSG